jgi:V/A-type H+-transporting ATPase subunit E
MTEESVQNTGLKTQEPGAVVYDEQEKLNGLRAMILRKGDLERERLLSDARAEAERWTEEQTKHLEAMVAGIRADAMKRAGEMTARHLAEAETARGKDRLRLQNELARKALLAFQNALIAFDKRPDYGSILTGVTAEVCERLPKGQKVKLRLREEDAPHGEAVAGALRSRFPDMDITFDAAPARIVGGVYLYSEEERWHVAADWKSKTEEMADEVAKAVLADL